MTLNSKRRDEASTGRTTVRGAAVLLLAVIALALPAISDAAVSTPPNYTLFESGQVRPVALSPDGLSLYAVNTPDGRLEAFDVTANGLAHRASIPVGLEPVAVAVRSNGEVWVVNHVSDSISVVAVGAGVANRVTRTLLVGDEPRDIVFAGPNRSRAFITTAHRGQNNAKDPQLTTPGIGRADVWVFDANALGSSLGGTPLTIVTLFADTPRALAVTPDGTRVYAAAHFSGNRTTTLHRAFVLPVPEALGGLPAPFTNHQGVPRPWTGLIVKYDGSHWVDEIGRNWDDKVRFNLPDLDVFAIDAMAATPRQIEGAAGEFSGVGTTLFNMVVNPVSGKVYVSNLESRNQVRFEGAGIYAGSTLRGHQVENRITVIEPATGRVMPRHLNPHINYSACCAPIPNVENGLSLALPQQMAISGDGSRLYLAATGSDRIAVIDTKKLEAGQYAPDASRQYKVAGGGPTGLVLDETRGRLYVMTRFDNGIAVLDAASGQEIQHTTMANPEPASVRNGRRFLYDARLTSSHGDSACATCHINGDTDQLAWDLGDPDGNPKLIPGPFRFFTLPEVTYHPMKGPMGTQSLRGMANHGPMHWRGDRNGGFGGVLANVQPNGGAFDEEAAFRQFNPAFVSLLGRSAELPAADMQAFTDFVMQLTYPPNPIRALDNSLTPDQQRGSNLFHTLPAAQGLPCAFCHKLDRAANAEAGVARPGFFGSDGRLIMGELPQTLKIPQFRNLYQKVGRFGLPFDTLINPTGDTRHMGDQIRGFGFIHDGSLSSPNEFLGAVGFTLQTAGPNARRQVESFLFAFDSNLFPIVGQQITLSASTLATAGSRESLMVQRAEQGECDLVVHGFVAGRAQGFFYSGGRYLRDRNADTAVTDSQLRQWAQQPGQELTWTCTPPGSGRRTSIDRDLDGVLDGDES